MRDAARRALEDFAAKAIERLVEPDGPGRFFCEFCAPAKPTDAHASSCPVADVLPLLRLTGDRSQDRRLDDPPPMVADGTPQQGKRVPRPFPLRRND